MSQKINDWTFQDDSPIGVTYGFNGVHATEAQLFVDMAALGASRVRYNAVMDLIVGNAKFTDSPSTWNWSFLDAAVLAANQNGVRVTIIARGLVPDGTGVPNTWTVSSPCDSSQSVQKYPTTAAGYAKIAVAMCRRYSGDGNPD